MNESTDFERELESHRAYLLVLARGQIPADLRSRLDASDVVQDTLLEAHRNRDHFRGNGQPAFASWLRRMLDCNLIDAIRGHHRQQRDVAREMRSPRSIDESALRLEEFVIADQSSPSMHLDKQQRSLWLAQAIEALPEAQRDAILMRYSQAMSIIEIAQVMNKSTVAVAGLLKRGTSKLREMAKSSEGPSS